MLQYTVYIYIYKCIRCRVTHRTSYKSSPQKHCRGPEESRSYKQNVQYTATLAGNALEMCMCWALMRVWWAEYVSACVCVVSEYPCCTRNLMLAGKARIVHFLIIHIVDSAATRLNKEGNISLSTLALCDAWVVKEV